MENALFPRVVKNPSKIFFHHQGMAVFSCHDDGCMLINKVVFYSMNQWSPKTLFKYLLYVNISMKPSCPPSCSMVFVRVIFQKTNRYHQKAYKLPLSQPAHPPVEERPANMSLGKKNFSEPMAKNPFEVPSRCKNF
ncbi:hypothetical protein NPIL_565301 [Nephila pilipes]|uniref:Uncharacterized protein n=1 Tax=Nephila pilipes TaxID=299642 RepID=A0A8X6UED3_NEPPI|nr:hypothetical protein NPIL_565301 [Nephila pilipes]